MSLPIDKHPAARGGRIGAKVLAPGQAYWIVVPGYVLIWYYGRQGHKIRKGQGR
jgi:hypothetical protein